MVKKSKSIEQLVIRLDPHLWAELNAMVPIVAEMPEHNGRWVSRSRVARLAIKKGLEVLQRTAKRRVFECGHPNVG